MAWTFRKRKKLFPGVRLNYGSSGLSLNVGVPGANVTVGANGVYANTGIPGTGIRNRRKISNTDATTETEEVQVTEKDIRRAGCIRNIIYIIGYVFSYALEAGLIAFTIYGIEENIILLACIMGILAIFFFINTIRLHLYHRRGNYNSTYTFAIIITYLLLIVCILCTIAFWSSDMKIGAAICVSYDLLLIFNLYYCYKYRIKHPKYKSYSPSTVTSNTSYITPNQQESINNETIKKADSQIIPQEPSIDYTKEGILFFSQRKVRDELRRTYTNELIDVCAYVVNSEKCVLTDIQAELGVSYQKVLESVKILEKARIVKAESNRRKVMVTDETTAIRLLLRYAKERRL